MKQIHAHRLANELASEHVGSLDCRAHGRQLKRPKSKVPGKQQVFFQIYLQPSQKDSAQVFFLVEEAIDQTINLPSEVSNMSYQGACACCLCSPSLNMSKVSRHSALLPVQMRVVAIV